jgi:hypothetical protein
MSETDPAETGALEAANSAILSATDQVVDSVVGAFTTPEPAGPSGASLKVAIPALKTSIIAAFKATMDTGYSTGNEQSTANADAAIEKLGDAIATAIHTYFQEAWVNIQGVQSIHPPGVVVATAGPAVAHVGATTMPIMLGGQSTGMHHVDLMYGFLQ